AETSKNERRPAMESQTTLSESPSPTHVAYAHVRSGVSRSDMKRMIERDCIARALSETRGNITRAAALLGMKRPRLSQLVKHYGLRASFWEDRDSTIGTIVHRAAEKHAREPRVCEPFSSGRCRRCQRLRC